jgi:hypothetical protein
MSKVYNQAITKSIAISANKSQVIIPETDHKDGGSIQTENAPMTHPAVAFAFRDAQYSSLSEARQLMDKGFALRKVITTDPYTKVIPKSEASWRLLTGEVGCR